MNETSGDFDPLVIRPIAPDAWPCYAHTPNDAGEWHPWAEHARNVGDRAGEFAAAFGGESLARYLGMIHDVGKLAEPVQAALRQRAKDDGAKLGVPHKAEGAALAWLINEPLGDAASLVGHMATYGHHHQIPALALEPSNVLSKMRREPECLKEFMLRANRELGSDLQAIARDVTLPGYCEGRTGTDLRLGLDLFTRMIHSSLVDADFLDTAAHFRSIERAADVQPVGMVALRDAFMTWYRQRFENVPPTEMNDLRRATFEACVNAGLSSSWASQKRIYRLSAQTGTGKTLSALAFALNHAATFGKRRVICALPFTSITNQTATDYRSAFASLGPAIVLEHHSNLDDEGESNTWRRLSAENWDAEMVVTTTVQLFQSFFNAKPASARKLHRVANSVIILDEVQALPMMLVPTILDLLAELVQNYGVTVLLASATQPTFWDLSCWRDVMAPVDIIPRSPVPVSTQRVRYQVRTHKQSWEEIACELVVNEQVLAIVNTTSDALKLNAAVMKLQPDQRVLHLSTRMYSAHRQEVLEQVRDRLARSLPLVVVSTQLIEAGVDVDFPVVYRAWAPADSVVQSAGRCNREGRLGFRGGRVVIFDPLDGGSPLGLYKNATGHARWLFDPCGDWEFGNPEAMDAYYREVLQTHVEHNEKIISLREKRFQLNFPAVADAFQMIEETGRAVVVTQRGRDVLADVTRAIDDLRDNPRAVLDVETRRLFQRHSANVPNSSLPWLAVEVVPGTWQLTGDYDWDCGITLRTPLTIW